MTGYPNDWLNCKLSNLLVSIQSGFACGEKNVKDGLPHLRMNNIDVDGSLNLEIIRRVPQNLPKKHHYVQKGDILFCATNSVKLVGKSAIFAIDGIYSFSNHLVKLTPDFRLVNPVFLQKYLWFLWKKGSFERYCKHWVNQSTLPKEKLVSTSILLPPIKEQHRIVAKLEKLLAKVDKCKERLAKIPLILKRFRQAVVVSAISGELTAEWRRERGIARQGEAIKLKDAVNKIQIGPFGSLLHKSDYVPNEIPIINPTHLQQGQIIPSFDITISDAKKSELERYILREGDIIVARRGEMGRCAVVRKNQDGWICGTGSLYIRPCLTKALPDFLQILISSPIVIRHLERDAVGTTMTNLNEKIFSNLMVHIPFLKEQEIIVQRVNDLFSFADQIEARYQNARNHVDHLAQSILAKAFRGELVPQDPNDPPASELLKHIQAEREKQPELRKAGKRGPTHQRRARPKA